MLLQGFFPATGFALENMRPIVEIQNLPQGVKLTFDFSRIDIDKWPKLLSSPNRFHEAGYGISGQASEPALPIITELIPVNSVGSPKYKILESSSYTWITTGLKATPVARYETDPPTNIQNYDWSSRITYTTPLIRLGDPVVFKGRQFLPVTLTPLFLDFDQEKVRIPLKLEILLSGVVVDNPGMLDPLGSIRSLIPEEQIYDKLGHYLIITPSLFEPYLDHLVDWKLRKGHQVTVVNTSEAGTTPASIKAFIQDGYDTWDNPPEYILLIGDEDRGIGGFYVYNPDNEALVTDHPYTLLEGDDTFPEAWVGRLSVDTIVELAVVMNKIVSYESQPYMDDPGWFNRALMVCTVTAAISTQQTTNWVSRKLSENGFTDIDTVYYPMQTSIDLINNPINNGVSFVNYRGLGAWDHWIGPYYYNSHIDQLRNGFKLPILTNIVCGGGNFAAPVDPVFGEKWLRAGTVTAPKGAVAFIGPSEVHTHTQFNNVIDIGLYSAIFDRGFNELGPALWEAKMELWRNYHESEFLPFGQSAEFYLNVYNILGDPGMAMWTDTPKILVVDFPASIHLNDDHISVSVMDESGLAVPGAFVFIYNSENAIGLRSDASGMVSLPFVSGMESTIDLTITGTNLHPLLETIIISESENPVSYSDWTISPSGTLEAGGIHGMNIALINDGNAPIDLTLELSSTGNYCTILDTQYVVTGMDPGESLNLTNIFDFSIDGAALHGEVLGFDLDVATSNHSWTWHHDWPIQASQLEISDMDIVSGDLIAGDSILVGFNIANRGGIPSSPFSLTLDNHPLVEGDPQQVMYASIGVDEIGTPENYFWLHLSDQIFPGELLSLSFIADQGGRIASLTKTIIVEQLNPFAPSHADAYGYRIYDDMDVSYSLAPDYEWLEINPDLDGPGARFPISDRFEEDDETFQMDLPFPVSYYGQTFDVFTVCSNGWLSLGPTPELSFYNSVIPSPIGPNAMIAPFWDDLITVPGSVNYFDGGDHFIVEWSQVSHMEINSNLNFQVIIYDSNTHPTFTGDNVIKMQFKDYYNFDTFANFSTTGIESPDYSTGLQASFNNIAETSIGDLHSGQAVLFTTDRAERFAPAELSLSQTSLNFTLNPWSQSSDSIAITNTGASSLVYNMQYSDEPNPEPAPNPVAGFHFTKGGPEPSGLAFMGPERELFDYEWKDQDDVDGPEFIWRDISQPVNEVNYPGDPDDISIGPIQLGFSFPFFDENYDQFYFSSNGSMSFLNNVHPWSNLPLPNGVAPAALIAPWWDDLNNDDGIQGVPYFWSNELDTAIVTWDNFPKFGTADFHTFQAILIANGDIIFQYQEMDGTTSSSTVGIQNTQRNKGLQITYNTPNNIGEGTAIRIHKPSNWLRSEDWAGQIEVGETGYFVAHIDTRNLQAGPFSLGLTLISNAGNIPQIPVNINLEVRNGVPPTGDINADYQVNIQDLTLLIEYILILEHPDTDQFSRADLREDSQLNILDVTRLLSLFD